MFYAFTQSSKPAPFPALTLPYPMTFWGQTPQSSDDWSLTLSGLNGERLQMSLMDLDLFPQKVYNRRWVSHGRWSIRAQWEGVLLQHVIEKLRPPHGQLLYVHQRNIHGNTETIPLKDVLLHRALIVRKVNGQALSPLYGGPLHLMVFHCYGYKGLHQLTELSLVETPCHDWSKQLGLTPSGDFIPGQYFAWDLKTSKPIKRTTEVDEY